MMTSDEEAAPPEPLARTCAFLKVSRLRRPVARRLGEEAGMNDPYLLVAVPLVILAWAVAGFAITRWGAGIPNRNVRCPHRDSRATISALSVTKNGWGRAIERDVVRCSLLGDAPVTCDKDCLAQL